MYLFPPHKDIKLIYIQLQTYIICRYRYCILTFTVRDIPQTGMPVPTSRQDAREKKLFKPVWGARRPDTKHFQPTATAHSPPKRSGLPQNRKSPLGNISRGNFILCRDLNHLRHIQKGHTVRPSSKSISLSWHSPASSL